MYKRQVKKTNNDSNIYFSIARGYKQGGFNLGLDATDNLVKQSLIYDPEYLTNYELGISSYLKDRDLNYSLVIFFSERKDQQVLISRQVDPSDPNTFSYLTQNAAEGENYGIEITSNYLLTDNLVKQSLIYDPEYLTNYELGVSSYLKDKDLNYSLVIFFSERKDQQVLISRQVDPSDPNTFSYLTQNAAEGENYGIEITSNYLLTDNLYIYANLGFLKTKIKNWESRIDLEDRSQAHAPERSYSFGGKLNLKNNFYLKLDINGKSSFYYSDSHDNQSKSYQLTNLTFGYLNANFSVDLWIRNLFDKYYSTRGFFFGNEAPNFIDTLYRRQGDPKHIGISLRYNF